MNSITDENIAQMNELLDELNPSHNRITRETLYTSIADATSVLAVAENEDDGSILGMAMLTRTFLLDGERVGTFKTVVVHEDHRRKGIARRLIEKLIKIAEVSKVSRISLTSNDSRVAAHEL
jgi:N-acetylglutamate synthase-like GNAT family acetyltransferase